MVEAQEKKRGGVGVWRDGIVREMKTKIGMCPAGLWGFRRQTKEDGGSREGEMSELEKQHEELTNLRQAVQNHKNLHEDATRALNSSVQDLEQATPGPDTGEPNSAASTRQLEERVDHVVALLGNISTFAAPATISEQFDALKNEVRKLHQPPEHDGSTSPHHYKMLIFRIEKFDDYTHQDLVPWWEGFTMELQIRHVPEHSYIGALFLNSIGGCQIWLSHLATIHDVQVANLHKKIREDLTRLWKKHFIVDDAPTLAINRLFSMTQGNTPTHDRLTEWQKIVATPDLDLPFPHLHREFYNRSCAALSLALSDRELYTIFAEIIDKAREIIKTNRTAAHEKSAWQPAHVEKGKFGPRPQPIAAVQLDNIVEDPASTPASREGDQVAVVQLRSNNSRGKGKVKTTSPARNGQPVPWVKFHLTEAKYKWRSRRSLDEHVEHLRTVLEQLRRAKYKANRDKCEFARQELAYLGHFVMPQGIRPLTDKIEAIQVWPELTNTTNVRSFMGLAGYNKRFIIGYSRIAAPLTRLQSPKVPFVFDDDVRQSFQALKTAMLMAPVLSIYDPTLPMRVTTDASGYGIGAALEKHDGDDWHPVEYFSHKVPPINSLDDARKKELLAFVMALKRWSHFLLGRRRFTWVTNNNPLTYYKTHDTRAREKGRKPSFLKALILSTWDWITVLILFMMVCSGLRISVAVLVRQIVDYLQPNYGGARWHGYAFALASGVVACLLPLANHLHFFFAKYIGVRYRVGSMVLVNRKLLQLTAGSLAHTTTGKCINLISNDVRQLDDLLIYGAFIWGGPLEALVVSILIAQVTGTTGMLAGMATLVALIPLETFLGRVFAKKRQESVKKTDARVKMTGEVLNGILAVKMFAWEEPFRRTIHGIRREEKRIIWNASMIRGFNEATYFCHAVLAAMVTFLASHASGHQLRTSAVFYVLTLLQLPRLWMGMFFGMGVERVAETLVTSSRLEKFFEVEVDRRMAEKQKEKEQKKKQKEEEVKKMKEEREKLEKEIKEKERKLREELKAVEEEEEEEEEEYEDAERLQRCQTERGESSRTSGIAIELEAMNWLDQFGCRTPMYVETEEEKNAFVELLAATDDPKEKDLLIQEKKVELNNKMVAAKRQEFEEKKKLKEEGERLQKQLQEQKGQEQKPATNDRLFLPTDTLLHTNQQLAALTNNVQKLENHQFEFEGVWNFLQRSAQKVDRHIITCIEKLDEQLVKRLSDPAVAKKILGGGGGDGGDGDEDGGDGDKKGKGAKLYDSGEVQMTPKLTRWAAEIDQYDFELKPVKGKYNVVADALSRRSDFFGAIVTYLDVDADVQEKIRKSVQGQDEIEFEIRARLGQSRNLGGIRRGNRRRRGGNVIGLQACFDHQESQHLRSSALVTNTKFNTLQVAGCWIRGGLLGSGCVVGCWALTAVWLGARRWLSGGLLRAGYRVVNEVTGERVGEGKGEKEGDKGKEGGGIGSLLLKDLSSLPWVKDTVKTANTIVKFIRNHHVTHGLMMSIDDSLSLLRPTKVRFGSVYQVLQRLTDREEVLNEMVDEGCAAKWRALRWSGEKLQKKVDLVYYTVRSESWWAIVRKIVAIMEPVYNLPKRMDREGVSPTNLMEFDDLIARKLANVVPTKKEREDVMDKVKDHVQMMRQPVHAAAFLLDPWTRDPGWLNDPDSALVQNAMRFFCRQIEAKSDSKPHMDIWDHLYEFLREPVEGEVRTYEHMWTPVAIKQALRRTPVDWWTLYGGDVPQLQQITINVLGIWSTATPAERNWASMDFVHSKRRNSLSPESLEKLVYIHWNMQLPHSLMEPTAEDVAVEDATEDETADNIEEEKRQKRLKKTSKDRIPKSLLDDDSSGSSDLEDLVWKGKCWNESTSEESDGEDDTGEDLDFELGGKPAVPATTYVGRRLRRREKEAEVLPSEAIDRLDTDIEFLAHPTPDADEEEASRAKAMADRDATYLRNVTFALRKGELLGVMGRVGSGKSTLLAAVMGEVHTRKGYVRKNCKTISYAAQKPFIVSGTLRSNIVLWAPWDEQKYKKVIHACALQQDIEIFPDGDETLLGERGQNLSGGQKARLGLARAAYHDADLYLLDDPLSAVDPEVGKHLFEECILGYLKGKSVVMVTHQLQYLPRCDRVILMQDGEMKDIGTYEELQKRVDFHGFIDVELALIEVEEQRQLAAEVACLQAEAAATAEKQRLQAEVDADTHKEAQVLLQRHEVASIERLKFRHFEPSNGDDATPEEQHKEFLSKLVTRLLYTCNYQQSELEKQNQELQQQYQDLKTQHQELANLRRIVQSHEDATRALNSRVLDLDHVVPGPDAGEFSSAPSHRQLEQRVDHVVAMLGDITTFAAPTTISNQLDTLKTEVQQLQSTNTDGNNPKQYKMPTFQLEKFDDYTHQDPVLWWEAFTTQLRILPIAKHVYIGALFMNSKGGCQIWLTHLAVTHGIDIADLKDKTTWEELTRLWKKRFIVDDAPALAINHLFTMTQGNTATRDWLTEWQKIAATLDLDSPFPHLRREFYNRSCAALSQALGDREQYATFAEIIDKAREIIKTNRAAAHEKSTWQPTYVENVRTGPRQQQFAAIQSDNTVEDPAATQASRPHGVVPDRPIRHEIILEDGAVPPRGCIYRMSEEELSVLRAQLDDLLEKGWIRPSSSPYGAPVLFVRKKNKDLRLCIDYRKLNAQTIRNAGPLPRIDDLLERLGGAKFFSKLDLKSGYHQLEIRQEDRYKTAFKTRYGHYEWLPEFGMEHLRTVLERLRQAKYKANRDKCEFARQELEYLGHYVTPQGIRPLADKIEALRVWPEPTNTTDVRSFMGLAGYYQRFIIGYSRIAAPMTRLQSPKVPFVFDDDARRSFQALKTAMLMAPVLSIYDPTLPTRVTTGAFGYGIRAVLEQHDGDDWHPVEYFSHKVPPINSLDDARKEESLRFVMALKRWRHFLLGHRRFTWVTDNNPLTYYKTQDTVSCTIGRWMYFIDQFDFTPKHLPSLSNRAADALSRRPDLCAMTHHAFAFDEELQRHFIRGYESDPDFATLYAQPSSDHPPASHYRTMGTCSCTRGARTYYVSHATIVFGLASSTSIMIRDSSAISESTALLHGFDSDSDGPTSSPTSRAEATRLQAEAEAAAEKQRLQAAAEADTQTRCKEVQDLLQQHEAASVERLKFWHFEPAEDNDDAAPEEQHKEFLSKLMTRLAYTCNHLQSELEKQHQELAKQHQELVEQHQELANLRRTVQNHKDLHEDATRALHSRVQDLEQAAPRPDAGESSSAPSTRQLQERVDHVVAMLGNISPPNHHQQTARNRADRAQAATPAEEEATTNHENGNDAEKGEENDSTIRQESASKALEAAAKENQSAGKLQPLSQAKNSQSEGQSSKERKETGAVGWQVYWGYYKCFGRLTSLAALLGLCIAQTLAVISDWYVAHWASKEKQGGSASLIYMGLVLSTCAVSYFKAFLFFNCALDAASKIHDLMLSSVFGSPLRFFHVNPIGRILNRFSADQGIIDDLLPQITHNALQCLFMTIGIVIVIIVGVPWVGLIVLPVLLVFLRSVKTP
ncbi:hypothetical protein CBR_g30069 [Chara braunii]|uniref:ABC transmembrane type-1 domain-containing protein n=1 Tax=Chara braunii TaxID=69332 RepID=A0A388LBY7_CHABU|nr:hypothetical protein CBR_g30069 [Chara braunii]|eukprot:GBG79806.1 hypothetical protein CBR_g30069 [Chara braunii]